MAVSVTKVLRGFSLFVFSRYPFANAITLLLLLAERAKREKYPPLEPNLIYAHLGMFVACGVCMGFNMQRKSMALVHTGQLLYLAFSLYNNDKLKYSDWLKIKMAQRAVGVAGFFLLYAYFTMAKPRSVQLRRLGETLVGLYIFCVMYTLMESPLDKRAFLEHVPGGNVMLYIFIVLYGCCALCYLPGYFVHDVTQGLIIIVVLSTLLVDTRLSYWHNKHGMDYWAQVRLLSDNLAIIIGFTMYLTCTPKRVYNDPVSPTHLKRN